MKTIGRVLSLIVCLQLGMSCNPGSQVSSGNLNSTGPSAGFIELSGNVTLAFIKVSEILVPTASAADLDTGYSAESMATNVPADCKDIQINKNQEKDKSTRLAHLIDLSDYTNPCRLKEIQLKVSADGSTASYKIEIESELIEDKIVGIVFGDDENQVYKNAIFAVEKGARIVKQHLNDETSVQSEILGLHLKNEFSGLELNDQVKTQFKERIKALKQFEDFGFDLLGDKNKMIRLLKNPKYRDNLIQALLDARIAKELEGEKSESEIVEIYNRLINLGTEAANEGNVELQDFMSMKCSSENVFVSKYGKKEYAVQFSAEPAILQAVSERWGIQPENGRFTVRITPEATDINGHIGKLFWVVREEMAKSKSEINFKIIIADPEKKEADLSCNLSIAPPSFDLDSLESFNFKAYRNFDEALTGLKSLFERLGASLENKFLIGDNSINEEESILLDAERVKAEEAMIKVTEIISDYFNSLNASRGLSLDVKRIKDFNFKAYSSPQQARDGLSVIWDKVYSSFKDKMTELLEAKELSQSEFDRIFNYEIHQGKLQNEKTYFAINNHFHGLYVAKKMSMDTHKISSLDYKSLSSFEEAINALGSTRDAVYANYKQLMQTNIKNGLITPEEADAIIIFENELTENAYWTIYSQIEQHFQGE